MMQCLFLHPVNALYARHLTKMLGVTTIIAMLHHLIKLFAFSIVRPDTSQTQETGFTLFCRKFRRSFFSCHKPI